MIFYVILIPNVINDSYRTQKNVFTALDKLGLYIRNVQNLIAKHGCLYILNIYTYQFLKMFKNAFYKF